MAWCINCEQLPRAGTQNFHLWTQTWTLLGRMPPGMTRALEPGMSAHSHRDLHVWQKAMSLATDVYKAARTMPRDDRFALGTHLQRTAVSLPSNIAEGWGRGQRRVLGSHVRIATGSNSELQTQIELAERVDALRGEVCRGFLERSDEVARMLHGLLRSVENRR